jgi:hypothetical protein
MQKAQTIGAFQKEGLSPEDSLKLWNILNGAFSAPTDEGAKVFAEFYKAKNAQPSKKENEFDRRKEKRDNFIPPPGVDGGGGIPEDDETKEFMSQIGGVKNKDIFKTK